MASLTITVGAIQIALEDESETARKLLKMSGPLLKQLLDQETVEELLDQLEAQELAKAEEDY